MLGAGSHRVPDEIVQSAKERKTSAKAVQKMMLAVLQARLHAEKARASDISVAGDRGSDLGDFDTEDYSDNEDFHCMDCTDNLDDDFDIGVSTLSGVC